jgi:hypothetical protein
MEHHPVTSSHIESIAHKGDVMHVKYKSGITYEFKGVTEKQYHEFKKAESHGKHLTGMGIKGTRI